MNSSRLARPQGKQFQSIITPVGACLIFNYFPGLEPSPPAPCETSKPEKKHVPYYLFINHTIIETALCHFRCLWRKKSTLTAIQE